MEFPYRLYLSKLEFEPEYDSPCYKEFDDLDFGDMIGNESYKEEDSLYDE